MWQRPRPERFHALLAPFTKTPKMLRGYGAFSLIASTIDSAFLAVPCSDHLRLVSRMLILALERCLFGIYTAPVYNYLFGEEAWQTHAFLHKGGEKPMLLSGRASAAP